MSPASPVIPPGTIPPGTIPLGTIPLGTIPAGSVVVGVDGSPSADKALLWAVEQAAAERRPLALVHAVGPSSTLWLDQAGVDHRVAVESMRTEAQELLATTRETMAVHTPELAVHEVVRVADPRDVLLELSHHAAVVVLGSRGRGPVRSLLLGSVGVAVTRHAGCPVVIHRPGNPGPVRHGVVAGVDGSERSAAVLEFAYREAALRDQPLTVVHCFWDLPATTIGTYLMEPRSADVEERRLAVAEAVAGMAEKYPEVQARTKLARGLPDAALVGLAERANLLVVGAHHGGTATAVVFGSVAASVVEHATCPVAVVPVG